ncbi:MAG: hypothetical protein U5L01_17250 [Rheinheimera sp.]|nr:hypothetical protein [Rheinheimera sp.]
MSVGIEDPRDLLADLAQAFAAVEAVVGKSAQRKPAGSAVESTAKATDQQFRINPALAAFW